MIAFTVEKYAAVIFYPSEEITDKRDILLV